ncbi:cytochrome P450 [Schizophyllum commune H4-8]|uniref:cytochrome P450 n=1 Tax=Schizophyllum commune (strain H4-8 / FGSC 9210) TaxID=578458 RepID=UPI00215E1F12|nr:cytochrome P450 [Schizophyllum commune H4-8]KAI5895540.1 cytochrome P450 [Schizophyllum commune H4-8]
MLAKVALAAFTLVLARTIWRILSRYVQRSPLDNIPGPAPPSLLTGNFYQLFHPNAWGFHEKLAEEYGPIVRTTGLLGEKQLYVADSKALHSIIVKDQDVYEEHPQFTSANHVLLGEGLTATLGEKHRKQRKLMNPVFSIAHMRNMIPMFQEVIGKLRNTLEEITEDGPREVDVLHWMSRTALELIGRNGLGYSFDSLAVNDPGNPYSSSIKELAQAVFKLIFWRTYVLPEVYKLGPAWFRRAVVNFVPWRSLHDIRDKVNLIWNSSKEVYTQKKAALLAGDAAVSQQISQGKDIMSLLIRANMKAEDPLDEDELVGQMSVLIFGGTDTTSSALSRILYLLAKHPDVQDRLRQEIRAAKETYGVLTYDELESLPLLDAILRETLRLYPPASQLLRKTVKDAILPFGKPVMGVDGRELTEVYVPAGTPIIISIINANRSKDMWGADALEWKPERWLAPLPQSVADAHMPGVYSNLMTFLGGGRACIGFKFAQLEMKVALVELLDAFELSPSNRIVRWRMSNISSAYVEDAPQKSQLPIVLTRAAR